MLIQKTVILAALRPLSTYGSALRHPVLFTRCSRSRDARRALYRILQSLPFNLSPVSGVQRGTNHFHHGSHRVGTLPIRSRKLLASVQFPTSTPRKSPPPSNATAQPADRALPVRKGKLGSMVSHPEKGNQQIGSFAFVEIPSPSLCPLKFLKFASLKTSFVGM